MIPTSPLYPQAFDTDDNLYVVHDGLRLRLAEDYNPGDTSIVIEGDLELLSRFSNTGQITLTEQCSEIDERAISFYYTSIDLEEGKIEGLELLPEFSDNLKLKRITNVTQNVMAAHHNNVKDAIIAIQEFIGVEGEIDTEPFGDTLEGRTNFLRNLVLTPRAWFSVDKSIGLVPLTVEFSDKSFRLGTDGTAGDVTLTWDFGDKDTSVISLVSFISATDEVPEGYENYLVLDEDGGKIRKTYVNPGLYPVSLTARNDFGEDTVIFDELIQARVAAPDEAVIQFVANTGTQIFTPGIPSNGPYTTVPKIRSPINELINIEVPQGPNSATPNISFAGELLNDSDDPFDPINSYTWGISDDLTHSNGSSTKALFSIGGIYDLRLRVDTEFGGYRITSYEDCMDIVENTNLWLWVYSDEFTARHYEYGLISETFKTTSVPSLTITRDSSFLDNVANSAQQIREFNRNTGFAQRGTATSGKGGSCLLYWASGRSESELIATEQIYFTEFNGFSETYITRPSITRPWNWVNFSSNSQSYFVLGTSDAAPIPYSSPTNLSQISLNLTTLTATSGDELIEEDFAGGATELMENPAAFSTDGSSTYGNFSVYRSVTQNTVGFFGRNDGVGAFFRIKSFYRLESAIGSTSQTFRKLQDIQGPTKSEGALTDLISGLFFINNSGSISAWDNTAEVWNTGGPGVNSIVYRAIQDTDVTGFDDVGNTLLLTSDGDRRAYISFDYSENAFIKFSQIDLTFSSLVNRPSGTQFLMEAY